MLTTYTRVVSARPGPQEGEHPAPIRTPFAQTEAPVEQSAEAATEKSLN